MKNKVLLFSILLLAFVLRFWKLNSFPPLNADEAALGYNAYSLIQTGMDEHGNPWPIHFQSFNDFKPGLMVYLIIPFVKLLGLSVWAVRIPGALAGVATVWVIYYLFLEITRQARNDSKNGSRNTDHGTLAIVAAAFLAISPWHIHFSRGGWEVNVATFFITTGIWLFIKYINQIKGDETVHKRSPLLLSVTSFVLALYTYHAARVIIPLLGLGFILFYFKLLMKDWKKVFLVGIVGILLLIPLILDLSGPAGLSRAAGVGIFSDPGPLNEINEQRGEHGDLTSLSAKIFHNKPLNYSLAIAENWLEHFHGEFLFLSGDEIQRNKVPEHGQMYMIDALFLIIGAFTIIKIKHNKIILLWFFVSPIAAALTFQSPHALRAQNMVIPLIIISSFGFVRLLQWIKSSFNVKHMYRVSCVVCGVVILWSFARYQHLYWIHMPRAYPYSSQYGFEELMSTVTERYDDYDTIIITDRYDQPYILTLFYLQYSPQKFQSDHELTGRDGYGFSTVREFDKFQFVSLGEWSDIVSNNPNTLIAGTDEEVPDAANVIKEVQFPNGETAFQIVEN